MRPVHIVTGFLGSGKTTLLRALLARPDFADTAVIVNEFGEVGLDHLILEEVEEDVVLLSSGCLCCAVREDLQRTLRGLLDGAATGAMPPFARIVVETSGLADPAPIVATLRGDPSLRGRARLGTVLTVVDALAGLATLDAHEEAVRQAQVADRILVAKADLAAPSPALLDRLAALNPFAPIVPGRGEGFAPGVLLDADLGDEGRRAAEIGRLAAHGDRAVHGAEASSFVLSFDRPIDWIAFGVWLSAVLHVHGDRILRVKGVLDVAESDTPVVLNGVQHVVHPPMHLAAWPDGERRSRVVFITRGLEAAVLRASLDAFLGRIGVAVGEAAA